MRGGCIDDQKEALEEIGVHGLRRTSSHDQVLLLGKAHLNRLSDVSTASIAFGRLVDLSLDEVVPTEDLFSPNLEDGQHLQVGSIGQSELILAVTDEPFDRLIVVPDVWVGNQRIDAIHLLGDLTIDWDLATKNRVTKLSVVPRSRLVR
jgi:hypothetical protein